MTVSRIQQLKSLASARAARSHPTPPASGISTGNQKRDTFPCGSAGEYLLIDPTTEDPHEHLRLVLGNGEYRHLTAKGQATIQVFGLNRADAAVIFGRDVLEALTDPQILELLELTWWWQGG